MRKSVLIFCSLAAAAGVTACGSSSSTAPGIQLAPSAGATQAPPPPPAPTLPAALSTKPTVPRFTASPPKHLVIKDLITGTGAVATPTSTVTVQYVGVLYKNGTQFDASWNDGSGQPTQFSLSGGVIQGWTQGIPGMRVGGRRLLIIPPSLAYKNRAQAKIPANSTLVFVVDLHQVA